MFFFGIISIKHLKRSTLIRGKSRIELYQIITLIHSTRRYLILLKSNRIANWPVPCRIKICTQRSKEQYYVLQTKKWPYTLQRLIDFIRASVYDPMC